MRPCVQLGVRQQLLSPNTTVVTCYCVLNKVRPSVPVVDNHRLLL